MAIIDSYDESAVKKIAVGLIEDVYNSRIKNLEGLNIDRLIKNKNPYLFRLKGLNDCEAFVKSVLAAYVSSSEESSMGKFFEELVIRMSGGQKSVGEGIDVTIDTPKVLYAIEVKSSPHVFNSNSKKRQQQNFTAASRRFKVEGKEFRQIVGYGYGYKFSPPDENKTYYEYGGREFWTELTGDDYFYIKIMECFDEVPPEFPRRLEEAYSKAEEKLIDEFRSKFCSPDGKVDWERLLMFVSGGTADCTPESQRSRHVEDSLRTP